MLQLGRKKQRNSSKMSKNNTNCQLQSLARRIVKENKNKNRWMMNLVNSFQELTISLRFLQMQEIMKS